MHCGSHAVLRRILRDNPITTRYMGVWSNVKLAAPDSYLTLQQAFINCKAKKKVNLTRNTYQDDTGNFFPLPSVQKAEKLIFSMGLNKEYSPILGDWKFCRISLKFALGDDTDYNTNGLAVCVQSPGGTAGLRLGLTLIKKFHNGKKIVFIPNPSSKLHEKVIKSAGLEMGTYKYYDPTTKDLDFNSMIEDIKKMPDRCVILLNACAHDPTGMDPSQMQWDELSTQIKVKNMLALFDMSFQGLASGDPELDCYSVRKFASDGNKIIFVLSFSKNMCLYGERAGCLTILTNNRDETEKITSQMKMIVRGLYSSPPVNGSRIVVKILEDPGLRADWRSECREMADRMIAVRKAFKQTLLQLGSTANWDHFDRSVGMVTTCGLSVEQIDKLSKEHFVFMAPDGRMGIAGMNSKNIDYIAASFHDVTK